MWVKEGQHGTLYRYRVTYKSSDPYLGHVKTHVWGYSEDDALTRWEEGFESEWERDHSDLLDIKQLFGDP